MREAQRVELQSCAVSTIGSFCLSMCLSMCLPTRLLNQAQGSPVAAFDSRPARLAAFAGQATPNVDAATSTSTLPGPRISGQRHLTAAVNKQ